MATARARLPELRRGPPLPYVWKGSFWNLRLPASRPGSKFRPVDLSSDASRMSQLDSSSRKWPSPGKFWHHEVAAFSSKTRTTAMPQPLPSPAPPHQPLNIKIQSKGRRKGFPKGKGGSPKIIEIIENDKEFKGNPTIPRPPPEPHFPWQHRRPSRANLPLELSELWRGPPPLHLRKATFLNLWLPASRPGSKFRPPGSKFRWPGSKFRPSAGKFWHHEVAAFSSKTLTKAITCLSTSRPSSPGLSISRSKAKAEGKGFQRERGGSPEIIEIVENDKEFKGNSMIPCPPPEPRFPWHHRRPCTKVTRPNSLLWTEVPLALMSGNSCFLISGSLRAGLDRSSTA